MLPTMGKSGVRAGGPVRSQSTLSQYLRRIVKWQQMDIEYCFWQMLHLCIAPKLVYQHTKYHKQTKNQWARDDPAFVVITCALITVASLSFCAAYAHSWSQIGAAVFSAVVIHFLLLGLAVSSLCWFISNKYLRLEHTVHSHAVEQRVEWLYSFDVHCNAFFPLFTLLYVVQYFLSPLLLARGLLSTLLSNALYAAAFSVYHYLNFLGYHMLPFLDKATLLLSPIALISVLFPFLILIRFNPTQFMMSLYFS